MEKSSDMLNQSQNRKDVLKQLQKNLDCNNIRILAEFSEDLENGIDDIGEARERIAEIRKVIPPIISVPKKYISKIEKQGYITSHPTWTGHKILAATLNRVPYGNNDARVFFAVKPHVPIEPRFTGEPENGDYLFKGVVMISENYRSRLNIGDDLQRLN